MPRRKRRKQPVAGATFSRTYKGRLYTLTVVGSRDGAAYSVGGRAYRSPSAAAYSITKSAINGWRFWNMDAA